VIQSSHLWTANSIHRKRFKIPLKGLIIAKRSAKEEGFQSTERSSQVPLQANCEREHVKKI
jgi:hypothetical protein